MARATVADTNRAVVNLSQALRAAGTLKTSEYLKTYTGNSTYGYAWRVTICDIIEPGREKLVQQMDHLATHGTRADFNRTLTVAADTITFSRR